MPEKFTQKPKQKVQSETVGFIAAIIGVIAYFPLVYQVVFKKATHSLHYLWIALVVISSVLWILYGIKNKLLPNIYGSVIVLGMLALLTVVKFYYESRGEASHQQ